MRPAKKIKLDDTNPAPSDLRARRAKFLESLSRQVSPPENRKDSSNIDKQTTIDTAEQAAALTTSAGNEHGIVMIRATTEAVQDKLPRKNIVTTATQHQRLPSPFQLTRIQDLPDSENVDTITLYDILSDPLIKEAWIFNYCFDIDWLMQHFDEDVRDLVQVKIVHGSWRREDLMKLAIDEACSRCSNVNAIQAYLPDAFGTHHTKMFILFRHDDCAQVVIHTANMVAKDWRNMTQAVWRSPLLLQSTSRDIGEKQSIGKQFGEDLLRYLKAYGNKLKTLTQQLERYDFSHVKAALVASVPSRFKNSGPDNEVWGHEMLRRKLSQASLISKTTAENPHFVFQISSIASLPANWLDSTLYAACQSTKSSTSIIFPMASDVAKSLDGYASGGSIHTKAQTAVHLKQISTMRPQLCRWTSNLSGIRAGRDLAAPHIKTYLRFASRPTRDNPDPNIEWALVTSANLSSQAWGSAAKLAKGEKNSDEAVVHIQSYEIGVLVWPELFDIHGERENPSGEGLHMRMVPTFRTNIPESSQSQKTSVVGFRMPYDLPLTAYGPNDMPWSPRSEYRIPDRHGVIWTNDIS